jgi:hypothetical protein
MENELLQQLINNQNTQHAEMMQVLRGLVTREELQEVKDEFQDLDKFVNGNGMPGAKTRLAVIEKQLGDWAKLFDKLASDVAKEALAKVVQLVGVPLLIIAIGWAASQLVNK